MSLRTAPCPQCQYTVVFGERRCRKCKMPFDYGAPAPREPSLAEVQQALAEAAAEALMGPAPTPPPAVAAPRPQPAARTAPASARPASPPSEMAGLLDDGRYDGSRDAHVVLEDIPGLIDSTLFAAYTPQNVDSAPVEGLEHTAAAALPRPPDDLRAAVWLADERALDVGDVALEDIPGLIDSTLYAAYTPKDVATETIEGLELNAGAGRLRDASGEGPGGEGPAEGENALRACRACGAPHDASRCPSCGAAARTP